MGCVASTQEHISDKNAKQKGKVTTAPSQSNGPDAAKLDRAFEAKDMATMVALLSSTEIVELSEAKTHPWAVNPRTIGTLASVKITQTISENGFNADLYSSFVRKLDGIKTLVEFLKSEAVDRVQYGVDALRILTNEDRDNATEAREAGAMELLLPHLESNVLGMAAAVSRTLRNLYIADVECRREFANLGGIAGVVNYIISITDNDDILLEALLDLQDLIQSDVRETIPELSTKAVEHGVIEKFQMLAKLTDDGDVRKAIEALLGIFKCVQ
eukprot:TRINITY_DN24360_c1_g6_i1.p1 TRINITY_DN24360_c1_g6~~TRINITY_DN24360_c1_g6_i1.p1  ORF type:complete len:272 (-),score=35.61 TRINITY_DN24360_c1_g6_i1:187-1002(-)